jgi:DNA-binding GntR family transcriptional regulator
MVPEPHGGLSRPDLEHRSLREQVIQALRTALLRGELQPGVVYSAPVLAAEFGVSATPVREAMLDLAKEGLVETVRNKGFRIIGITEQDLDDVTEVRALIEIPATLAVARSARSAELEPLRELAQDVVAAAHDGDLSDFADADRRFHLGLLALTGNAQLVETVSELRKRSRLAGLSALAERGLLVASAEEHEQLLDLMLAHDLDGTARLLRSHLGHIRSAWAWAAGGRMGSGPTH